MEKREDGTSANRGSSRGACIPYISFCASIGSNIVWSHLVKDTTIVRGNIVGVEEEAFLH